MANIVEEMKAKEAAGEIPYPKGAHPAAAAEYAAHARAHTTVPTTPAEANAYWEEYERQHPEVVVTPRKELVPGESVLEKFLETGASPTGVDTDDKHSVGAINEPKAAKL